MMTETIEDFRGAETRSGTHGPEYLGRVAFEAYREEVGGTTFDGKPIPDWNAFDGNGDQTRAGWRAAAVAVLGAQGRGGRTDDGDDDESDDTDEF